MEKDVIITCFACSAQAPCKDFAKKYFTDEPIIISVPGGGGSSFRAKAIQWAKTGDAFAAALKENGYKDVTIKRRGLVTFSVGWSFADELFKFQNEIDKLNAYILLDGCHTTNLDNWIKFATKAANADAWMTMAHTAIIPPTFPSSTNTNTALFKAACSNNDANEQSPKMETNLPEYILQAQLPVNGVDISLGASPGMQASKKHWVTDPLVSSMNRGYLTKLGYSGNGPTDHVYVAWHVAPRLWNLLGDFWSSNV